MQISKTNRTFPFFKFVRKLAMFSLVYCVAGWSVGSLFSTGSNPAHDDSTQTIEQRITKFTINASVVVLGTLASVGNMSFEETIQRNGDSLEKILHLYGNTNPDQVAKDRDFGGEFKITKRFSVDSAGNVDEKDLEQSEGVENFYAGTLKRREKVESETVVFYRDHVLATREDGLEKRIDGKYESPLGALDYLLENDIKIGDTYESRFILSGHPYIFKCEVSEKEKFKRYGVSAFKIDVTIFDGFKKDENGNPLVKKKKGGIRIWLCKEGKYKNRIIRLNIKYKWYLTLKCELKMIA